MVNNITLTASMRSNLSSLKTIQTQMDITQVRLSTGKKVNSAIDNASSYYQARALTNRASDLESLLDNMGQGIQTIQAAMHGLDNALSFIEQATAITNQANSLDTIEKSYNQYLKEGYKEITASMSANEIQELLIEDAKIILKDNINLDCGLRVNAKNISIFGNGKTLSIKTDNDAAITVNGRDAEVNISGLNINAEGTNIIGVKVIESGKLFFDNIDNIFVTGENSQKYYFCNEELFNGKEYTASIYEQLKSSGSANNTAIEFAMNYKASGVADSNTDFGVGQWYIGSIGEWTELFGYDYSNISDETLIAVKDNQPIAQVNKTLTVIGGEKIRSDYYWTSSETGSRNCMALNMSDGTRLGGNKSALYYVRCFQNIENCYNPSIQEGPQIGDIIYSDKTWSSADEYVTNVNAGKIAVGVSFDINTISGDVKIVALQDASTRIKLGGYGENFTDVPDISSSSILSSLKNTGEIILTYKNLGEAEERNLSDQFNDVLQEFDELIANASYQGVNLLQGNNLNVIFNENRNSAITILGSNISCKNIGIITHCWESKSDVEKSSEELKHATEIIRSFQSKLSNNYSIIKIRQNFTEALSNILETGADKLVLADMNEESANYLALQTRQQLATNSLSLASQSAQSVLSLF